MKLMGVILACLMGTLFADQPVDQAPAPYTNQPDCSALTPDEQEFASKINGTNKMVFCQIFTPAQRAIAMQLTTPDATGYVMSPDEAVEKVAQDSNVKTAPATSISSPPASKPSSQGCPVRIAPPPKA